MRISVFVFSLMLSGVSAAASVVWSGSTLPVLTETPAVSSGLDAVYVAPTVEGLSVTYTGEGASEARWSRFSSMGGAFAEEVATGPVLERPEGDMGYIVEAGGRSYMFWLVDYSRHPLELNGLSPSVQQDCGRTSLDVSGSGAEIAYYTINGRKVTLSRGLELEYRNLVWSEDEKEYRETATVETFEYVRPVISVPAVLCPTEFTLTGDRFSRSWNDSQSVTSPVVEPHSVEAHTSAEQQTRDADNEVTPPSGGAYGGSAPCVIDFSAKVTDAAIFREWQISSYPEFDDVDLRVSELDFTHTFNDEGVTYVRFYCANSDASCDYYGETYEISIGASSLKCPNAFSPFNEDGVNDVWKVSYSSIVSFECHIFNRAGHLMASFSDPSGGWDGKYKGKFVPAGVYYYVIKAKGADGRSYDLSGDINIVDYK